MIADRVCDGHAALHFPLVHVMMIVHFKLDLTPIGNMAQWGRRYTVFFYF